MLIVFLAAFALLLTYMVIEAFQLEVTRLEIVSPRLHSNGKLRVVFVSDVHYGFFYNEKRLQRLIKVINEQKPDVVILGGDQIKRFRYDALEFYRLFANGVQSTYGIYAVLGNHDYLEDKPVASLKAIKEAGIHSLNNASFDIRHGGNQFRLGGVGDYIKGSVFLFPAYQRLRNDSFLIFVTHNPELTAYIGRKYRDRIDLALAGHMHGRQMNFGLSLHRRFPHYAGQVQMHDNTYLYISRGLGVSNLPMRFRARPELVVIDITGKS